MTRILRIDSSARTSESVSRTLTDKIIARYRAAGDVTVVTRDVADGLPLLTEAWVGANATPDAERSPEQRAALALSDELVSELQAADTVVIGVPIYNFGIPAALKAWVDLIARAGVTFRYTAAGPQGLLENKRAVIAVTSGGVPVGSPADFASPYLTQVLQFVGISDVSVIRADQLNVDPEASNAKAAADLAALNVAA